MVALMKCENGLKFTGCIFEDIETAHKWLKEKDWCNPYSYRLVPVAFYTKDGEIK